MPTKGHLVLVLADTAQPDDAQQAFEVTGISVHFMWLHEQHGNMPRDLKWYTDLTLIHNY